MKRSRSTEIVSTTKFLIKEAAIMYKKYNRMYSINKRKAEGVYGTSFVKIQSRLINRLGQYEFEEQFKKAMKIVKI